MYLIRPIAEHDLEPLLALVGQALSGLTTLPPDVAVLRQRILKSQYSFSQVVEKPGSEGYVFVLEETQTKQIVGICGIEAKTGGYLPFYAYQMGDEIHDCEQLGIHKAMPMLRVYTEHDGPSEICSLFLSPQSRKKGNGRLLSLSRFLFMADFKQRFESQVIAEMRGHVDENGSSPFWEAIAKHFIDMDLEQADYLSIRDKRFIGDLMPRHPIYVSLLSKAARDVIGVVHRNTRPALALLEAQGFEKTDFIDIFEAGPIVRAHVKDIFCVRQSQRAPLAAICPARGKDVKNDAVGNSGDANAGILCLVSNARLDFRCVLTMLAPVHQADAAPGQNVARGLAGVRAVMIDAEAAAALEVKAGDDIRWVAAYPTPHAPRESSKTVGHFGGGL